MAAHAKSSSSYAYTPLGNKESSIIDDDYKPSDSFIIRIIVLQPAEHVEEELRCKIEHLDLSGHLWSDGYDAISYVWGEPIFSHALYCEGTKISITSTLNEALRRFRSQKETRRLWADAVCINQTDRKELSQQVQRMSQIYFSARSVLVWLGDGPEMDRCINFLWGLSSSRHESSVTAKRADASIDEELGRFFGETRVDAIQLFLALPWFTRRWIVQEAVAENIHFYCGSLDITSHALHHATYILRRSTYEFDRTVLDHIKNLEVAAEMWKDRSLETAGGILDLLVQFNRPACTDDRDRIYAYLGIANDVRSPYANITRSHNQGPFYGREKSDKPNQSESIAVEVDYEADCNHVYSAFAEQMLQQKQHLDILHCSGAFRHGTDSKSHQSWAPDWTIPMRYKPFISVPWFSAGGPKKYSEPFLNYPWCSVEGFGFDVVSVCCIIPGLDTLNEREKGMMPPVAELCSVLQMRGKYHTGEMIWQVLGQTFIADHALNHDLRRHYTDDSWGVTGKRMKRNATERDIHTLLDWWTESDMSGLSIATSVKFGKGPQNHLQNLVEKHTKSLHRISTIGVFLKPAATEGEWDPTSYEQQSHWHSRVSDELEPYFHRFMFNLANKSDKIGADKPGQGSTKLLTDANHEEPNSEFDDSTAGEGPDDEPYDCDWRYYDGGFVCFEPDNRNLERYAENANNALCGRAFFITSKGYIGIGPDDMAKGDTVAILYGARTPFILRNLKKSGKWKLLGDCYVHGIMSGEALEIDRGPDEQFVFL
ncbi:heterokaryon incompatibility protein-domain-containing protein [Hyaloscypha finlandica]|nr:heterokaryon incompatibility protein-domain-containing protein [Hyaloscypha finlandica]